MDNPIPLLPSTTKPIFSITFILFPLRLLSVFSTAKIHKISNLQIRVLNVEKTAKPLVMASYHFSSE